MQILTPDFPDKITFFYLLEKCWSILKKDVSRVFIASLIYLFFSLFFSLVPVLGTLAAHSLFYGLIYQINNFRMSSKMNYFDLFWPFHSMTNFTRIFILTILIIPVLLPLIIYSVMLNVFHIQDVIYTYIFIATIPFCIYFFIITMLATFVYVLEDNNVKMILKRSFQIVNGHAADLLVILLGILFINVLGILSIFGILITGPLSALIMLEFTRFLIRKFELKELALEVE